MTELQAIRIKDTETRALIDILRKAIVADIIPIFANESITTADIKAMLSRLEKSLVTADEAIIALTAGIANYTPVTVPVKKAERIAVITPSVIGRTVDNVKDTTRKAIAMIGNEFLRQVALEVPLADIRKSIVGTRRNSYTDGRINTVINSKELIAKTNIVAGKEKVKDTAYRDDNEVIGYTWNATFDNTCVSCMALAGKKFYYNRSGSKFLPPLHPRCQCYITPIYSAESKKKSPQAVTLKEWAADPDNQDDLLEAMGPTRYKLYTDGKLKIERFTDIGYRSKTLAQLLKDNEYAFKRAKL